MQVIYVKLSVVMGLGWVLGFIAAFTDWTPLWYSFIVVNSLQGYVSTYTYRATVTSFCSTSVPVGFCRRLVGKTLRSVCRCDSA